MTQFGRNNPIISHKTQDGLAKLRLGIIGCGLGSNIAVLAARTGIKNFVIADGDVVELSNLNRQQFEIQDIGHNKAVSLKKRISRIQPRAKIQAITNYIVNSHDIEKIAARVDIVVNTADFDKSFFTITKRMATLKKTIIFPLNVGFGSVITVFDKNNIKELLKISEHSKKGDGPNFEALLLGARKYYLLPKYFSGIFNKIIEGRSQPTYIPQLGVAAELTAGEVVTMLIRHINAKTLPLYPKVWSADLMND